jgi:hypothetical protein
LSGRFPMQNGLKQGTHFRHFFPFFLYTKQLRTSKPSKTDWIWTGHISFSFWAPSQNCEKRLLASSCLPVRSSVCPLAWKKSAPTGGISMKSNFGVFFDNLSRKF